MQRTQLYLEQDQVAALDAVAEARGLTRSDLIRAAVDEYLDRNGAGSAERVRAALRCAFGAWATDSDAVERIKEARLEIERRLADRT